MLHLRLLGVGAMRSPRYAPAALLLGWGGRRVMFDGGGAAVPSARWRLDAWLVTDARAELIGEVRRLARARGVEPQVASVGLAGLTIEARPVAHTSHPTYGYLITAGPRTVAWAPEFWELPAWAAGVDLLFADAAGWRHQVRFAGGVGGHAGALATAPEAARLGVKRLVFAHIGRPAIRAIDAGERLPFGEWGHDGATYRLVVDSRSSRERHGEGHA